MATISLPLDLRRYNQILIGAQDGVNLVFTSAEKFLHDFVTREGLHFNGVRQREGAGSDYVVSESVPASGYDTVTFAIAPLASDVLMIDYTPVA